MWDKEHKVPAGRAALQGCLQDHVEREVSLQMGIALHLFSSVL